jgi:hypothetical protein
MVVDNFLSYIPLLSIMLRTIAQPARQSRIYTTIEASQNGAVRRINYRESDNLLALVPNISPFSHVNYRCLAHVINLGNVAVMSHITKIAAMETTTVIWEYDPTLANNRVLGGSLDVISAIRTLAIKVH